LTPALAHAMPLNFRLPSLCPFFLQQITNGFYLFRVWFLAIFLA